MLQRFLCLWQKKTPLPALLLLLSVSNPLRWASIRFFICNSGYLFANIFQRQTAAAKTRTSLLWSAFFYARVYGGNLFVNASHQAEPGRNSRSRPGFFAVSSALMAGIFLSTFPSGKLPQPIRALHFCGDRSFVPALMPGIYFVNISQSYHCTNP